MRRCVLALLIGVALLGSAPGCSHTYRKAYAFEPEPGASATRATLALSVALAPRLQDSNPVYRFLTAELYAHGQTCPTSRGGMTPKLSARYLGTVDLDPTGAPTALDVPAEGFLVVTARYEDRHYGSRTNCEISSGFRPVSGATYGLMLQVGTGQCAVRLRDANESELPLGDHTRCAAMLEAPPEAAAEPEAGRSTGA